MAANWENKQNPRKTERFIRSVFVHSMDRKNMVVMIYCAELWEIQPQRA